MARAANPYGDGRAAWRIRTGLEYWFGLREEAPEEFVESS
jgi:UDP-N-acetylglucosamine 2-epimerase